MEDIIDIIVTETTNTIEITSQATDEIIDVNIIDNREDITLNVTPSLVEININSLTGNFGVEWGDITGTLADQTDLNTALGLKADLVGGKVPSSQLPSYVDDIVEVANYAALPSTGETSKIYVVLDTNKIYRWSGSAYIEIADSTAVWGAITGTLSSQTDLQTALNAKFDDPTGDTTQYIAGDGSLITFPVAGQAGTLVREVRNTTGATLTKGTIVYISGATGNKPTVSKAIATGDSTSAQTFGMCQANISNNSNGYVVCVGDITGLDTSAVSEGVQLYLSSTTAGTYTTTKQVAPAHLVYIGVVTRSHPTQGQIEVKIQNGYELDEIHDVAISSKANNDGLFYESSTSLWKNKSIATVLGYTPANGANYLPLTGGTLTGTLIGTRAEFTTSTSVDGVLVNNGSGRGIRVNNTGAGYGIIINNETASSAISFLIQKSGVDKIYFTDAGVGNFASSLTASSFVKSGGTSSQFLKADGSVDSSTYALDSAVVHNTGNETITGLKYFFSGTKNDLLFVSETVGYASQTGYSHFKANANHVEFINSTNTKATKFIHGNAAYEFTMPNASGTIALTSNLSSYLPLSGGTLTGALSGTSATFSGDFAAGGNITSNKSDSDTTYTGSQIFLSGTYTGIRSGTDHSFNVDTYNSGSVKNAFKIVQSGAATFSSSVTASKLEVGGSLGLSSQFEVYSASYGNLAAFRSVPSDGINSYLLINTSSSGITLEENGSSYGALMFKTGGSERMRITSAGLVGINTTTPFNFGSGSGMLDVRSQSVGAVSGVFVSNSDATARLTMYVNNAAGATVGTSTSHYLQLVTADTERMRITSGGNVLMGTTSYAGSNPVLEVSTLSAREGISIKCVSGGYSPLFIRGASNQNFFAVNEIGNVLVGALGTGLVYSNGGNLTSTNPSDSRLKKDIKTITYGLNDILKLRPVSYNWKDDNINQGLQFGFIAQEVQEVMPDAIKEFGDETKFLGLEKDAIYATLVNAIQELKAELDTLKNK